VDSCQTIAALLVAAGSVMAMTGLRMSTRHHRVSGPLTELKNWGNFTAGVWGCS